MSFRGLGASLLVLFLLTGCNTADIYQDDRYNPPVYWGQHVVRSGETLYSIAWRYGRDYRELGNANGIKPPYTIKPGQVIRLDLRGHVPSGQSASPSPTRTARHSAPRHAPSTASKPRVQRAPEADKSLRDQTQVVSDIQWRWPNVGPVIAGYSTSGKVNKGIDISGKPGDPIRAAASGSVVYAGSGLLGYGNLIIVNHNEHYLSAYAHNRKILVQEGENVRAGQLIAEMGSSGANATKLHFEIRKNGNPVDPMNYLPPR
ncbi:peptidoglycan DD-metalloendopeptidase family protein [Marinobacter halodurans]|uniref:peptidoglycan DD-metalloendopeptidase family protein n=1 Tax=Marinobacter halodurans TaxID=2528979 RepID=UPI001A954BA9|nr:peptidoglycan DD-metalloendopeptidase family protein [Marinobacter halodurans]